MLQQSAINNSRQPRQPYRYGRPQDLFPGGGSGIGIRQSYGQPDIGGGGQVSYAYAPSMVTPIRYGQPSSASSAAAYGSYISPPSYGQGNRYGMSSSPGGGASQSSNHGSSSDQQLSKTNLYIRGLQPNTTDQDLVNLCQGFGKIISTKAIIDQETQACKGCSLCFKRSLCKYNNITIPNDGLGYGFVDFETNMAAEMAVKSLQSKGIQAQMAKVRTTATDDDQQERDVTNLYIANLPVHITEDDLEQMFRAFGGVVSTRILRDQSGISRGVGFARMESRDKCEAIIAAFNGKLLPRHSEPLTVKFADGGNKKRSPYQSRQWVDRTQSDGMGASVSPYDHTSMMSQNGMSVPPMQLASPGTVPRYSVTTTPINYLAQGWLQTAPQYILHNPMTAMIPGMHHPSTGGGATGMHAIDPTAMLAAQIGHMHIAGATGGGGGLQGQHMGGGVMIDDHTGGGGM